VLPHFILDRQVAPPYGGKRINMLFIIGPNYKPDPQYPLKLDIHTLKKTLKQGPHIQQEVSRAPGLQQAPLTGDSNSQQITLLNESTNGNPAHSNLSPSLVGPLFDSRPNFGPMNYSNKMIVESDTSTAGIVAAETSFEKNTKQNNSSSDYYDSAGNNSDATRITLMPTPDPISSFHDDDISWPQDFDPGPDLETSSLDDILSYLHPAELTDLKWGLK